MKLLASLLLLLAAASASAQSGPRPADHPGLPPADAVMRAIDRSAAVLAAGEGIRAGEAARERVSLGSYEPTVKVGAQRRSTDSNERFLEWVAGVETQIRMPGKAALDSRLGDSEADLARLGYGGVRHDTERQLLRMWFDWLKERAQVRQWQAQVDILGRQVEATRKRVRAGDAPRLDENIAETTLAQAENSLRQARLRQEMARNDLAFRFPDLPLDADAAPGGPAGAEPVDGDLASWTARIAEHSHELALSRGELAMRRLQADRAQAEGRPDPTLSMWVASERGGAETLVGVGVSIPISGRVRSARAAEAYATANMAELQREDAMRRVRADAANAYATAVAAFDGWQRLTGAAERARHTADLTARAYALGELGIGDVMTSRRQAAEANLGAAVAGLDAAYARYRLMLDANLLWVSDAR